MIYLFTLINYLRRLKLNQMNVAQAAKKHLCVQTMKMIWIIRMVIIGAKNQIRALIAVVIMVLLDVIEKIVQ